MSSQKDTLRSLIDKGWSQESIAKVAGVTRPTIKKAIDGAENLDLEKRINLEVLDELGMSYKQFVESAITAYTIKRVQRPTYRLMYERIESDE